MNTPDPTLATNLRRRAIAAGRRNVEELEHGCADWYAMRRAADRGLPLVDFEDADGRLPHDDLPAVLLERVRDVKRRQKGQR